MKVKQISHTRHLYLTVIMFQVAHFYNTIDQQMIPSQQAMMLDTALAFERLIKKPKTGVKKGEKLGVQVPCYTKIYHIVLTRYIDFTTSKEISSI